MRNARHLIPIIPVLDDRFGGVGSDKAVVLPQERMNAASAVAATAQVRFVRIPDIDIDFTQGPFWVTHIPRLVANALYDPLVGLREPDAPRQTPESF